MTSVAEGLFAGGSAGGGSPPGKTGRIIKQPRVQFLTDSVKILTESVKNLTDSVKKIDRFGQNFDRTG